MVAGCCPLESMKFKGKSPNDEYFVRRLFTSIMDKNPFLRLEGHANRKKPAENVRCEIS